MLADGGSVETTGALRRNIASSSIYQLANRGVRMAHLAAARREIG